MQPLHGFRGDRRAARESALHDGGLRLAACRGRQHIWSRSARFRSALATVATSLWLSWAFPDWDYDDLKHAQVSDEEPSIAMVFPEFMSFKQEAMKCLAWPFRTPIIGPD